jgi:diguanylate cyclase (GGDEF)-like protein
MEPARGELSRGPVMAIRRLPVWELPRWLAIYVVAVTAAYLAATAAAARVTQVRPHDLVLFGLLLACGAATVEMTRRAGENAGFVKDVHGVWELPVAILLPAVYALVAPVPRIALMQWRIRRIPLYRRVFSAAAIGLSYGGASIAFHASVRAVSGHDAIAPGWILAVAGCGVLQWAVNNCLVFPAITGSDPTVRVRDLLLARERLHNDLTELCAAVLTTVGIACSLVTIAFALPLITVLQRSSRHAQLVSDSRMDSKTGMLNAGTWQREANAEVTRADRTRSPVALALIDIDGFKEVNDSYGHLVGDQALVTVARAVASVLREYDLTGRFGGDEFAVLLPQTGALEALGVAERIRACIADTPVPVGGVAETEFLSCTVSIGLAAIGGPPRTLTELLAAADAALYRAKDAGRNQAWIMTGTAFGSAEPDSRPQPTRIL